MAAPMPATMLAALLTLTQPAQPPAAPPPPVAASPAGANPDQPPEDDSSTALPLRPDEDRMTVEVMINGAGPFRFIVDSGATRTVVSRRLAALLSLPSAGMVTLHSVGGESQVDSVRIGSLSLNGLPPQPIVAPVLEEAYLGAVGILGIDTLANRKVVIDLVANRMTVEPAPPRAERRHDPNEIVVVARRRYGQLVLADAAAGGLHIYAVVDTGSSVTLGNLMLRDRLVRRRRAAGR